jgi:hypothetical protein
LEKVDFKNNEIEKLRNYHKTLDEEFDPNYYFDKILPQKIEKLRCNSWKIYI